MTAPDAEVELVDHLTSTFAAADPETPITVSVDFPDTDRLHVQVEQEGGPISWPIVERAQVRLVAWAPPGQRTAVKQLAADAIAAAAAHPGSAAVAGVHPLGARSDVSADPTTGRLMCWALVRVNLLH